MRLEVGYSVWAFPTGTSLQLDMVLDEYAVMKYGECWLPDDLLAFESWTMENDIVRLPLAGCPAGIDERNGPAVERRALAVGIR